MLCCKHCGSCDYRKDGIVRGHQRYLCKGCDRRFTDTPARGKPESVKLLALLLYCSGMSQLRISKILGVSDVAVLTWIRAFAAKLGELPQASSEALVVEVDEMCHAVGSKKTKSGCGRSSTNSTDALSPGTVAGGLRLILKPS